MRQHAAVSHGNQHKPADCRFDQAHGTQAIQLQAPAEGVNATQPSGTHHRQEHAAALSPVRFPQRLKQVPPAYLTRCVLQAVRQVPGVGAPPLRGVDALCRARAQPGRGGTHTLPVRAGHPAAPAGHARAALEGAGSHLGSLLAGSVTVPAVCQQCHPEEAAGLAGHAAVALKAFAFT